MENGDGVGIGAVSRGRSKLADVEASKPADQHQEVGRQPNVALQLKALVSGGLFEKGTLKKVAW